MTLVLHASRPEEAVLRDKVNRRRRLIGELVELEDELLAAGIIPRRVVRARSVVHGEGRSLRQAQGALDGRDGLD